MVQLIVTGGPPLFSQGVRASLAEVELGRSGGLAYPEERPVEVTVVVHLVNSPNDWSHLAQVATDRQNLVIVLTADDTVELLVRAYSLGAAAVLPGTCAPSELRQAVVAALEGTTVIRLNALRALVASTRSEDPTVDVSLEEAGWLRMLAEGMSVKKLADGAGYSERMMFRLLRDLYGKLGVAGRIEAILRAQERDII